MSRQVIVDAGPLVAFLSDRDAHHAWAVGAMKALRPPLLTCEAVMSESWHLLRGRTGAGAALCGLVTKGLLKIAFSAQDEAGAVARLVSEYADLPMSFADACLVRMAELHDRSAVLTLDSDFVVYRKHGRKPIPLLGP